MVVTTNVSLIIAGTGLGLITLSTTASVITAASKLLTENKKSTSKEIYEDEDGISTAELTKAHSTKYVKSALTICSGAGLAISTAIAVLNTIQNRGINVEDYVVVAAWGLIVGQVVLAILSRASTLSFTLSQQAGLSCILLLAALFAQEALLLQSDNTTETRMFALRITRLILSALAGICSFSFTRRPDVFKDGRLIDAQRTTTALSRYTFGWAGTILSLAVNKKVLEQEDLPRPDHAMRSQSLADAWVEANRPGALWLNLLRNHWPAFAAQWILTGVQSFGNVAPQFMLLKILRILEQRDAGRAVTSEAWIWVIALGLCQIAASWVEAWLFWISLSRLSGPIRSELSNLVFRKSMRRKDVKGDTGSKQSSSPDPVDAVPNEVGLENRDTAPAVSEEANPAVSDDTEKDEDETKSAQSTINLIGVDSKRIGEFTLFSMFFPGSLFKLIVSFWFLLTIIGWKALGAGLLCMSLVIPINIFFSKRYTAAQSRLMKLRDEKEAAINEALKGIRQIKFSALEVRWQAALEAIRTRELDTLWAAFVSDTALMFCWISSPIFLSATALAVYSLSYELTPSVAFTAIGVFNTLQVTLSIIPELTTNAIDAFVSVNRVQEYLEAPEIERTNYASTKSSVSFEKATFSFPSDNEFKEGDNRFILRNVNVSFPDNELSVISGKTGSGKSLLLAAVLKEVDVMEGTIHLPKSTPPAERHDSKAHKANWLLPSAIAYVAQIPWIENASIKDNILFGLPYDKERYNETIESCALSKDLETLPDGERTEIGEKGVNLSGGQKWRLSLARALYSRAGILVLDDIFSAVDAHVGRHIFEKGLTGDLGRGRTRILVTHHVELCRSATKYIVELGEGTVLHAGLVSELEEEGVLSKIISHTEPPTETDQDLEDTAVNSEETSIEELDDAPLKKVDTHASVRKFVEQETKEIGSVNRKHYTDYLRASGGFIFWICACLIFIAGQGLNLGRSWWLKNWTQANTHSSSLNPYNTPLFIQLHSNSYTTTSDKDDDLWFWLGGYIAISVGSAFLATFTFFYIFVGSIKASRALFTRMLNTVIRAPLRWHDTVPLGRIINRFTADFNIVDSKLANDLSFGARCILELVGIVIAGFLVSPYIVFLAFGLAVVCVIIARRYLVGAREVKRLESIAKSPVFSSFGATLSGISTIRAFDKSAEYITRMEGIIDNHTTALWHLYLFNRWFAFRMAMIGGIFSAVVAGFIITMPGIDASLAGFALFFALEYTSAITWAIRQYTEIELAMNASERILEYCMLPTEAQEGKEPPAAWPTEGRLEVENLSVTYAPDLPPVLNNLTFSINRQSRIGVVGRTGAGKSSLTLALFRFLEAQTGSIYIDGIDISTLKLETLRSRLAIIPQDPVLFSGTIRSNLDPFDERSDSELMDALRRVHLISSTTNNSGTATPVNATSQQTDTNKNIFKSLSSPISPSGLNLSQGQRQLLCLARSIVLRPKIMVLDEATSAVDKATDSLIQRSIREEFEDSTLIVIAHRLSTIADFDRILVLDQGRVAEFGTPAELLDMEGGIFKGMVRSSGEREVLEEMIGRGRG